MPSARIRATLLRNFSEGKFGLPKENTIHSICGASGKPMEVLMKDSKRMVVTSVTYSFFMLAPKRGA
jgi:hypothetical protein